MSPALAARSRRRCQPPPGTRLSARAPRCPAHEGAARRREQGGRGETPPAPRRVHAPRPWAASARGCGRIEEDSGYDSPSGEKDAGGPGPVETTRGGRRRHEVPSHHGTTGTFVAPRGEDRARHRGDLPPAGAAQDLERVPLAAEAGDGAVDDGDLAGERLPGDARPRAAPCRPATAPQGGVDRGGDRGVADPHLPEAETVHLVRDRLEPEGHGRGNVPLGGEGVLDGDVAGGHVDREVEHGKADAAGRAELVDGGGSGPEACQHLRVDARRVGRHALVGHAVARREDDDARPLHHGRRLAGDGGEPLGERLQPAEGARRLRQRRLARTGGGDGSRVVGPRREGERAEVVEGRSAPVAGHAKAPVMRTCRSWERAGHGNVPVMGTCRSWARPHG